MGKDEVISLVDQVFDDSVGVGSFWQNMSFLFEGEGYTETDDVFNELADYDLTTMDDDPDRMAKLLLFLAGVGHVSGHRLSEHLWLDKARIYLTDNRIIDKIGDLQAQTLAAFPVYSSQAEALNDYVSLFTAMASGLMEDRKEDIVNPSSLLDVYTPLQELGFVEDFIEGSINTFREFQDVIKYIVMRELVSSALDIHDLHYLRISELFELTTLELMVVLFLYFNATDPGFVRLFEALPGQSFDATTVGMINRMFHYVFGVNTVANEVLVREGKLNAWGMVHFLAPEGVDLATTYQSMVFIDDAMIRFIQTGNPGHGHVLYKHHSDSDRPTALDKDTELAELVKKPGARVFIHNTGDLCVEDEVFAFVSERFRTVDVFSLERAMDEPRALRREYLKTSFLFSGLRNSYPVFELLGNYTEQQKRSLQMTLQDLDDVATEIGQDFSVTCPENLFEDVYHNIRNITYFNMPGAQGQQQVIQWRYWLEQFGIQLSQKDMAQVLNTFPKNRLNVRKVLAKLRNRGQVTFEIIKKSVYEGMDADFGAGVHRLSPVFGWDSIVLPTDTLVRINEILTFYRYKDKVMQEWGFEKNMPYGKAISVMFYGPPGTGKTMMVHVIARDLGMDIFKVDLSAVLSKYIGETEKMLRRVFDAAQESPTILVFDEADSLFTKRTEVSNSTDRYANVEVNFLLQKMEEFEGITILTTNNYGNIDEAFKRRIRFKIKFPMPDAQHREHLWKIMLPSGADVSDDVNFAELGESMEFSPAHIKNAVLRAAFMAAERGEAISQDILMEAAKVEARDLGLIVRD